MASPAYTPMLIHQCGPLSSTMRDSTCDTEDGPDDFGFLRLHGDMCWRMSPAIHGIVRDGLIWMPPDSAETSSEALGICQRGWRHL